MTSPEQVLNELRAKSAADASANEVSLGEINSFGDKHSLKRMVVNINDYRRMLKERIMFVNESLTTVIPFTRENLYLICAYSGNGKSTLAANITYPLWQQDKKVLVISNEEPEHDILLRVACLHLGYNFNDYKKDRMPAAQLREATKLFPTITKHVKILDVDYKDGLTTRVEGVKSALQAVKASDFSCVLIDYFQLIKFSVDEPGADTYKVLNDLRIWLGRYIKGANVPIVMFAQLHSLGKRNNKELDSRIKDAPTIYEPSTVVIEVVPDFDRKVSTFYIAKDRFGMQGKAIECGFEKGRFVNIDEEFKKKLQDAEIDKIEGKEAEDGSD